MSMLEETKALLEKEGAFGSEVNTHIQKVVNAISFPTVDVRMKTVIAVAQVTSFASQFRRNIALLDEATEVPVNAISFVVTKSGAGKDSSVKAAKKCFTKGFARIEKAAEKKLVANAINAAKLEGEDNYDDECVYRAYMKPLPPVNIMPTTGPGLIQHINDLGDVGLMSGFLYTGEFSDELAYNQDMTENIKILSELYDTGDKEVKYTKGVEHRSKEISGQPVSALLVGSPGHILYDEVTKKKFHVAFMSKLARRSWFCYVPEKIEEQVFSSLDEFWAYEEELENVAKQQRLSMEEEVDSIAKYQLKKAGTTIGMSLEVDRLYKTYKRYNNDLADSLPNQESAYSLIRRHLQWKALKLAAGFSIMRCEEEISKKSFIEAIRMCELLDKDMELFEKDLNKSSHELLVDYFKTRPLSAGKAVINIHDLKKQGFMHSIAKNKLVEMVALCAGYDDSAVYSVVDDGSGIAYEPVIKTSQMHVSYKEIDAKTLNKAIKKGNAIAIDAAKKAIAGTVHYGFETVQVEFEDLRELLENDCAYSCFEFKDGTRGRSNILGGAKWLILDIDNSAVTAEEAHFMLGDINHHIALTSDNSNKYKFRVLLELDAEVVLDSVEWKAFYLKVAQDLGLTVDPLPQSQIFYAYAGRDSYSNVDAEPVATRDYVMHAKEVVTDTGAGQPKVTTTAQQRALLNDPTTTFAYAFESPFGQGSRNMFRMMKHAKEELGATKEENLMLLENCNRYWESPMDLDRLEKLKDQCRRLYD